MGDVLIPLGPFMYVRDIEPVVEEMVRAKNAGLHVVIDQKNMPRPTEGVVIALGPDPLLRELVQVGDTVYFSKFCNEYIHVDGVPYHILSLSDLKGLKRPLKSSASQSTQSAPEHAEQGQPEQQSLQLEQSTSDSKPQQR